MKNTIKSLFAVICVSVLGIILGLGISYAQAATTLTRPTIKVTDSYGSPKITISKVTGATGYRIYRKTPADTKWVKVATTRKRTYLDDKWEADEGATVVYTVKAYAKNADGKVTWSKTAAKKGWTNPVVPKKDQVLVDNEFFKLTYKGIRSTDSRYYKMMIHYENKESMKNSFAQTSSYWINGHRVYCPRTFFSIPSAREETEGEKEVYFYKSDFEAIGIHSIDEIEKIEFSIGAYPDGQRLTHYECVVYPTGLDKDSYVQKERKALSGDVLIKETEYVKVTAYWRKGTDFVSCFNDEALHRPVLIIENPTDEDHVYIWDDFAINGIELPNSYLETYANIKAGETYYIPLLIGSIDDGSQLAEYNIKKADDVTFTLEVHSGYGHFTAAEDQLSAEYECTFKP